MLLAQVLKQGHGGTQVSAKMVKRPLWLGILRRAMASSEIGNSIALLIRAYSPLPSRRLKKHQ